MSDLSLYRCGLTTYLGFLIALGVSLSARAQEDWSAKVLAQRDTDKKEQIVCVSGNKGVSAKTLSRLIAREKHGPAVASAAGQYLEKAEFDQSTPELIRQIAKRSDISAQALAYAALSPKAVDLIVGFASSRSKNDHQIAARMLAATAVMRGSKDRAQKQLAEKLIGGNNTRLNVSYLAEIEKLLTSTKDDIAIEYLLLAVAVDRLAAVKEAVTPHTKSKNPAVAMAAQYALASIKQPVDEQAILKAIDRSSKRAKPRPALSYDPRQTPRIYAIMAAGEAKLASAREPLMKLASGKDLHNAVYATRALSRIGGDGVAVQLMETIGEETPWPVRVAIYDAAGANPDKASIEMLREHYDNETGRLRQDALYAMLSIVAGQPEERTIESFDAWWQSNSDSFKVDAKATRQWRNQNNIATVQVQPVAGFYESAVISDRPVFSVDASISMRGAQIESLKQTLNDVVGSFPERVKFNIVDFGGHVRTLAAGGMIPAKNREQAMRQFTYDMELTLGTRTYDAIERAMNIPGMDTVHFLSDGAPFGSHIKSWQRIEYATRLYCQTAPVAVHLIYFPEPGKVKKNQLTEMMKRYAKANAGGFHIIEAQPLQE